MAVANPPVHGLGNPTGPPVRQVDWDGSPGDIGGEQSQVVDKLDMLLSEDRHKWVQDRLVVYWKSPREYLEASVPI